MLTCDDCNFSCEIWNVSLCGTDDGVKDCLHVGERLDVIG